MDNKEIRQDLKGTKSEKLTLQQNGSFLHGARQLMMMAKGDFVKVLSEAEELASETGADLVESTVPIMGKMGIGVTVEMVSFVLAHPDLFSMPAIVELEEKIFGGKGTLTTVENTSGAEAVKAYFGPGMLKKEEFAGELNERVLKLLGAIENEDRS